MAPLGLIAGEGLMPETFCKIWHPHPLFVLAYHGCSYGSWLQTIPHQWLHWGQVGKAIEVLRSHGIQELVFLGTVPRLSLSRLWPDAQGLKLLGRIGMRWLGDNTILTHLYEFLREEGFSIRQPQDLVKTWIVSPGSLGKYAPSAQALEDIEQGMTSLDVISSLDCSQGLAIQNGVILGIEAAEGTTACIIRSSLLKNPDEPLPVYVKRAKIKQNLFLDLPTIGLETLHALVEGGGYQGMAFQASTTLVVDQEAMKDFADDHGLFLWASSS